MDATWAAVVTGAFALLMLLIERGRRENVRDHGYVAQKLDDLKADVKDIDGDIAVIEHKLDAHLNDTKSHGGKKK
jgi:hypothetical protein